MIKKSSYSLLFIILGSVLLNFLNSPISEIFFDDKEIFRYAGFVIYKGGVPYRDFFDHKPPLIYFLNALSWQNAWLPWVLDTLFVLFATLLFYSLCKKNKLARPWFLPMLFNLLIRYSLVSFGNGMTREYTTVFLLIFFCIMQGQSKYKYYFLGIITGFTFWMQQDAIITLAPFLICSLFDSSINTKGNKAFKYMALTVGVLVVSLPLLFYFYVNHSLSYLWKDAFIFNLYAPGRQPLLPEKLKAIKHALHVGEYEMAFYTALILGLACLIRKRKKTILVWSAMLALILSVPGELITGRLGGNLSFIYYLLPLAATIPILVYVVFSESLAPALMDKTSQLIYSLILSSTLILGTLRFTSGFRLAGNDQVEFSGLPAFEYLKKQSLSDYQFYVFDDSNMIYFYNYFKILSPSPWIYHYFYHWSPDWDADSKVLTSIMQNLLSHNTRFILDCSVARDDMKNKKLFEDWQHFLQAHYIPILRDSSNRMLWRLQ